MKFRETLCISSRAIPLEQNFVVHEKTIRHFLSVLVEKSNNNKNNNNNNKNSELIWCSLLYPRLFISL